MKSNTLLDYAVFELSPNLKRCDLFVSSNGNTEKLVSGSVKPFISHLKFAEEQASQAVQSIKLEFDRRRNAETWFTKGTLERFVRFVSTPEVLEMVNTFDAEMSQLEAARNIYSQGSGDKLSCALGGDATGTLGADATKKELLRAIDVRLAAVREDLATAYARASGTGFNLDTVRDLQHFADRFGAHRLNEACAKFMLLCQRRPDLINPWKPSVEDQVVRSSWGSDMSIDDPTEDESGSYINRPHQNPFQNKLQQQPAGKELQQLDTTQTQLHPDQSKPTTCQQSDSTLATQQQTFQNKKKEEEKKKEEAVNESSTSQPSHHSRRLSVQDRISLFENKQKENSGGKSVAVGKSSEPRRLSSDVLSASAVEKAVLKRWSGASDMSIDLGNDKKDDSNIDSSMCTPSSSFASGTKSNVFPVSSDDDMDQKGFNDTARAANLVKSETRSVSGLKDQGELQTHGGALVGKDEEVNLKDQVVSLAQLRSSAGTGEDTGVGDQVVREDKLMATSDGEEKTAGVKAQLIFQEKSRGFPNRVETVAEKNQAGLQTQIGSFAGRVGDVKFGNRSDDVEFRDPPLSQSRSRISETHTLSLSGQFEGGFGVKGKELPTKVTDFDLSASQTQWKLFKDEVDRARKGDTVQIKEEDLEVSRMKVHKQPSSGTEQFKKLQVRRDENRDQSGSTHGINKLNFPGNKFSKSQENVVTLQVPSADQAQRARQSKGNQELNDELKMKANELEKLFAEHKLRVPGDQSSSLQRSKPTEVQAEQAESLLYQKPVAVEISPVEFQEKKTVLEPAGSSSDLGKLSTPPRKMVDHQDHGSSLRQSFSERSVSDNSRGRFYERYMLKRDAKLREESGTKGLEKESKLKDMQESLERSRAEMKAKFSSSMDRQNSLSSTRRHAEKLRSFNFHSSLKREQVLSLPQPEDSIQSEADKDLSEFPKQNYYGEDRSYSEVSYGDIASRSSQNKLLPNRYLSSPSPHTTVAPVARSASKISNPSSGRRRVQSENPLAQSVPNFSDFRKENTKPSSGVSKAANRLQVRTYACSKTSNEEIPLVKEEKNRWSQSLRKSSAGPIEFNDLPPLNSDGVVLMPLKFDKELPEQMPYDKFSKNVETKPFLRKGNGIGPGSGATAAKLKGMLASESLKNEEFEEESPPFEAEESVDEAKEEEDEELETTEIEDCANMDNGKPRLSQDSDKMDMSGSENGYSLRSISQIDPSSVSELPASMPSTFHALGSLHDSPGESPVSWNSHMHHPFSYPNETSDMDAFVDSPIGSHASWNSHSLIQTETDAAPMRKKWESAQKPFLVANSFNNQSRKDVTKGFKRLLKFGRKSRGAESLADWISATTSEGDDDTEDGRDPANRSSEDLRKSRMGFSQGHPTDDGFSEIELFNEQVQTLHSSIPAPPANFKLRDDLMSGSSIKAPRSFFSLTSFRSKGSDSKLR